MAYYLRRRQVARDNIAVGSVTGRERTINQSGVTAAMSTEPTLLDNILVGTTRATTDLDERFGNIGGGTTPLTGSTAYIVEQPINTNS